jgi:hypothetical protein
VGWCSYRSLDRRAAAQVYLPGRWSSPAMRRFRDVAYVPSLITPATLWMAGVFLRLSGGWSDRLTAGR